MIRAFYPSSFLKGEFTLPASKSYSIRAFLIAACGGHSRITNPSDCDDALVSMEAAKILGARLIRKSDNAWDVQAGPKASRITKVNVKESGTVLRFLLPLLSLQERKVKVTGEKTLKGRPNSFLLKTLRRMGMVIEGTGPQESIPITILGGRLKAGTIKIDATLSSQFISALLIACPQLDEDTRLVLTGRELVSTEYITMTLQVLNESGIKIKKIGPRTFSIKGGQRFQGLKNFLVPSDYGLAAFPLAACSLIKSQVKLKGFLKDDFLQADGHILSLLRKVGVDYIKTDSDISIRGPFALRGGSFSLKDCPDLVPIMTILALFARQKTRLYGIGHVRAKESDRISDLRRELIKIGARIIESANALTVYPQARYKSDALLNPHNDHRLAMAFSILGLKLGVRVKDIECVSKSYPGFVRDLKSIGARILPGA